MLQLPLLARGAVIVGPGAAIGFLGKVLELSGILLVGAGLWEGIAGAGLRAEFRLAASGVVLFLIGWLLERKWARRR